MLSIFPNVSEWSEDRASLLISARSDDKPFTVVVAERSLLDPELPFQSGVIAGRAPGEALVREKCFEQIDLLSEVVLGIVNREGIPESREVIVAKWAV